VFNNRYNIESNDKGSTYLFLRFKTIYLYLRNWTYQKSWK
jgi:hypothetical protein